MRNPVYALPLADPFVLRHGGHYYAYGTPPEAGQGVPVLHSRDLVHWESRGVCLREEAHVWAPEVAYRDGIFWMYYSAGGPEGEGHRLRVAASGDPLGPFRPLAAELTPSEIFSIDASPFQDEDGSWYLFYCRDFLEGERVGTGVVVDRLLAMDRLAGEPRVVVRPHADWQIFARSRFWHERLWDAWYTVEGPFAVRRHEKIYLLYSGGAWKEPNYGLSWAVAEHPLGPYRVAPAEGPTLLATVPGQILGPGHASVVAGPDGRRQYLAYHAWDAGATARTFRLEPLSWSLEGPGCAGATLGPRPDPPPGAPLGPWTPEGGAWTLSGDRATQTEVATAHCSMPCPASWAFECWVRALAGHGRAGLGPDLLVPVGQALRHLRVESSGRAWVDGVRLPGSPSFRLELATEGVAACFSGMALAELEVV